MYLKNKGLFSLLLCLLCLPAQAGWFGFSPKDRQEFVHARDVFRQGNYPQAVQELSQYIYKTKNIKRREARAYRLLGESYERLNRPEKALETYLEALEFHQKDIPLLLAAAALYQRTGLTDRSIELYDHVLKLDPDHLEALSGQAENYMRIGFYSKSKQYYDQFFQLSPQAPSIHRARYAYSFLKQRDWANAFINITMAKTEDPENADYWLLSARAYKGLGRAADALADLEVALWLQPQREDLRAIQALWQYQMQDYASSTKTAQAILVRQPEDELALFTLYLNLQKQGKTAQAKAVLHQIQALGNDSFAHRLSDKILADPK